MSAAIVYAEWWWTCDECGSYALEPLVGSFWGSFREH